jgi:cholesterol oxidase
MQSLDNSLRTSVRRTRLGRTKLTSEQGHGEPNPTFIRAGYEANALVAREIDGIQGSTWNEMLEIPLTAHFLGGCAIGDGPERGVVDAYHRVFNYPGLHVVDGSTVSANLGVNPSLTITAQSERAFSLWPNHGEADPRPALGEPYRRIDPVVPRSPVVPESAPGALRLRIAGITQRDGGAPAAPVATEPGAAGVAVDSAERAPSR